MMMVPQGLAPNIPQQNSQSSSASLIPSQQQPSGSTKSKKKNQKGDVSDGSKNSGDKVGNPS
jgi:hypothetical protein